MKNIQMFFRIIIVTAIVLTLCSLTAFAEESTISSAASLDLADGSIVITQADGITTFTQGETIIRTTAGSGIIRQTNSGSAATSNTITVSSGSVTLNISDLNIASTAVPISVTNTAALTINLIGNSRITNTAETPCMKIDEKASLTIQGVGELAATGKAYSSAAIQNSGTLTIESGTVSACSEGTGGGAGIGGAGDEISGTIIINGGIVTAESKRGAGIGGGKDTVAGPITINGGTIKATSSSGAGIGSGYEGVVTTIMINGGIIDAYASDGAGIGGGYYGSAGTIIIQDTTFVEATSDYGSGIGSGKEGYGGGTITIKNTLLTAESGRGAGIGGSFTDVFITNCTGTVSGYYSAVGGASIATATVTAGCNSLVIESSDLDVSCNSSFGSNYQERISYHSLENVSAPAGKNATLSLNASSASGLSYQWQKSATNSKWVDIEGETFSTINIQISSENADHYYRCKLTNGWGNILYTNSVKAIELTITQQPTSLCVSTNEIATFTVSVSHTKVNYQWQRSYDNGITWTNVVGETYSTLIVDATLSENDALYRCAISSTNGDTITSDSARITVESNAISYTTEYYCQKPDGNGYVLTDRIITESSVGSSVTAPAKTYEHFTENAALGTTSGTVKADNSLTLARYYDRNFYTISFDMMGGSSEADISTRYGAEVIAPQNPTRAGYTFAGWYSDDDLTEEYEFSTMPGENITVYAKWTAIGAGRGIEYKITDISLLDGNYNPISKIPNSTFYVEVSVKNLSSSTMDTLVLATYDEDGRFLGMQYLRSNPPIGYTFVLGTTIDNSDSDIATIKAFVLPVLGSMVPLAESMEFSN